MRSVSPLFAALVLGACARPARPTRPPGADVLRQLRAGPSRVTVRTAADSDVVRRVCVAPDSVLAGRADCVLRDQAVFHIF